MPEVEARAWWDDVQHLREEIEERRVGLDELAERRATRERARTGPGPAVPRRTVEIRGRTVPAPAVRLVDAQRRRDERGPLVTSFGQRPDRIAMWALMMGIVLILVAVATADAAPL